MSDDPHPTPSLMPGGDWLLAMFGQLESRMSAHGRRMDDGFDKTNKKIDELGDKISDHAVDDAAVEKRVALIEQARTIEGQTISRRGAAAGVVASSSVIILWEVVKHLAGWK